MQGRESQIFCSDRSYGQSWNIADISHEQLEVLLELMGWSYVVTWAPASNNGFLVWRDGISNFSHNEIHSQSSLVDQSDSQWHEHFLFEFYKPCVFHAGEGFAGVAFQSGQHLWISDSKNLEISTVSEQRQFLKAANIETVLCLPRHDGVLEFGSVYQIQNKHDLVSSIDDFLERSKLEKPVCDDHINYPILVNNYHEQTDTFFEGYTQSNPLHMCDNYINYLTLENQEHEGDNIFFDGYTQRDSFEPSQIEPNTTMVNKFCDGPFQVYGNRGAFKKWDQLSTRDVLRTQGSQMMLKKLSIFFKEIYASQVKIFQANELQNSVPSHGSRLKRSRSLSTEDVANNHKIAERKRRNKQNQQFNTLRSLIPSTSKRDKLSILQSTIGYLKEVKSKVEGLEKSNRELQSYMSSKASFLGVPQGQKNNVVKGETVPSSILTIEEKFSVFKNQMVHRFMDNSGRKMDVIKVNQTHDKSITIAICCRKRTSDILTHIISSLSSMGLETSSCFHASISNGVHIFLTTRDMVPERSFQQLPIEIEKILKALLNRSKSIELDTHMEA